MTERRTARRYDLTLPVMIRVPAERTRGTQRGMTLDVSTRGLYFVIDHDVETGSDLDITLTLLAGVTHGTAVLVRAMGKIIRVERRTEDGNSRLGVAAIIERYNIIRGETSARA
ncbi:MAG TPA: PilZ domain-containing protein [Candidatus Acidoferrales bacterium]|nr:PilZ domain-containing protein [Candidatus Acidoferrales bacterium]